MQPGMHAYACTNCLSRDIKKKERFKKVNPKDYQGKITCNILNLSSGVKDSQSITDYGNYHHQSESFYLFEPSSIEEARENHLAILFTQIGWRRRTRDEGEATQRVSAQLHSQHRQFAHDEDGCRVRRRRAHVRGRARLVLDTRARRG